MICRSSVDGDPLGEILSTLSIENLETLDDNNSDRLDATTKGLLKAISTSCRTMGHTKEAAKYARRCCFCNVGLLWIEQFVLEYYPK
jgi:hypothetical protein